MDRALNDRRPIASGKLMYSGYYTVPFDEKILLDAGEKFAIIVKIKLRIPFIRQRSNMMPETGSPESILQTEKDI